MRIGEILSALQKIGDFQLTDFSMETNRDTKHHVKHKFAEEIILPIHTVTSNVDFIMCKGTKEVLTSDGIKAKVVLWKELHLLEMESEIQRIYKMSAWDFAKRWYSYDKCLQSMSFIYMKLEKEG